MFENKFEIKNYSSFVIPDLIGDPVLTYNFSWIPDQVGDDKRSTYTASKTQAPPWPPPIHMVAKPRFFPLLFNSLSR